MTFKPFVESVLERPQGVGLAKGLAHPAAALREPEVRRSQLLLEPEDGEARPPADRLLVREREQKYAKFTQLGKEVKEKD